jgi:uncharacterized protein (DUF486 family)
MDRFALWQTIVLLTASNVFMNLAWYAHLGRMKTSVWWVAVLASWGLAFFEYSLMVPANRIGAAGGLTVPQLKILQEALTLTVFVPVCLLVLKQPITLDFLWAGLCLVGAVYFIFRSAGG